MKGFNLQKIMKQAQQMQKQMESAQEDLKNMEIEGSCAGGTIKVVFNGKNELKSIKIKPEAINPENPESVDEETVEMLEDLITSAVQDANKKVNDLNQEKMSGLTGGLGVNLPGLF